MKITLRKNTAWARGAAEAPNDLIKRFIAGKRLMLLRGLKTRKVRRPLRLVPSKISSISEVMTTIKSSAFQESRK